MNTAALSALAALGGSALGGITPLVSNYLIQRGLTRRETDRHCMQNSSSSLPRCM
jgi:hypothetical protein